MFHNVSQILPKTILNLLTNIFIYDTLCYRKCLGRFQTIHKGVMYLNVTPSDVVDYSLIATGMAVGISNIRSIIGLIVVCIQLIWIITKIIYTAVKRIKQGKSLDSVDKDVDRLVDKMEEVSDRFFDNETRGGGKQ